jgi:hypothetical protein
MFVPQKLQKLETEGTCAPHFGHITYCEEYVGTGRMMKAERII